MPGQTVEPGEAPRVSSGGTLASGGPPRPSVVLVFAACTPRPPEVAGPSGGGGSGAEAPAASRPRDARIEVPKTAELSGAKVEEVAGWGRL